MVRNTVTIFALSLAAALACRGQDNGSQLSARGFYHDPTDEDKPAPKPVRKPSVPAASRTPVAATGTAPASTGTAPASTGTAAGPTRTADAVILPVSDTGAAVQHLGIRYNVLLQRDGSPDQTVDPDRVFNPGECLAFEFTPNRAGYLYIFYQGSSGNWHPIYPSTLLPDESNEVKPRLVVRVPANACLEVEEPAGQERVFVVLTRKPEDVNALTEAAKNGAGDSAPKVVPQAAPHSESNQPVLMAQVLDNDINRMQGLQGRELRLKVNQPQDPGEKANTVYVVSPSPSDRIVTEIDIRHR
jgi:hypothetical protein